MTSATDLTSQTRRLSCRPPSCTWHHRRPTQLLITNSSSSRTGHVDSSIDDDRHAESRPTLGASETATAAKSRPAGCGVVVSTSEPAVRDGRAIALSSSSLQGSHSTSPAGTRSRPGRRGAPTGRVPPQTTASAEAETGNAVPRLRSWGPMGEPMASVSSSCLADE